MGPYGKCTTFLRFLFTRAQEAKTLTTESDKNSSTYLMAIHCTGAEHGGLIKKENKVHG